ncbi:hypothetical protein [Mesorhizobium sp. ESP7-2]|uniref:hypothetical protein n=1 Tax=Mesorhizobium sp. ESP7-2 TaxID=2876622 RepID=UPI001CCB37D0|nr:hypothetical protein [Mesorhizobium sp. ESP7-2]
MGAVLALFSAPAAAALPSTRPEEKQPTVTIDLVDGEAAYGWRTVRVENPDDPAQYVLVRSRICIGPDGRIVPAGYGSSF